jgi:hypothetical protein
MSDFTIKTINSETGQEVTRDMTAKEIADYKKANLDYFPAE